MKQFDIDQETHSGASYLILLILIIFMAALSFLLPYQRDDFLYAFIWHTPDRIHSLQDILKSLYIHYMIWGGRLVPVFIMQYFQLLGKAAFALVNGLMYGALVVLIYWHALGKWTRHFNAWVLSIIIVGSWFVLPDYGFTSIWACGTANYLWPLVMILSTLLPYHIYFAHPDGNHKACLWQGSLLFLLALVASVTMENTVLTMCLALICLTGYAYKQQKLQSWMVLGTLGSMIGTAILMGAPGNFARAATTHANFIKKIGNFLGAHVQILLGMLPVLLLMALVLKYLFKDETKSQVREKIALTKGFYLKGVCIVLLVFSVLKNNFLSHALTTGIMNYVLAPLGLANEAVHERLANTLSSTEAVLVYIIVCTMLYNLGKQAFGLRGVSCWKKLRTLTKSADYVEHKLFWQRFLIVAALACINNGAMLFSPQFPARSGYGSAVFLLIMMAMLLMRKRIYANLVYAWHKAWAVILLLAFVPMAVETLSISHDLYVENTAREIYIHQQVAAGATTVTLPKLSSEGAVLKHVYFSDLDNGFSKGCALPYYGLKDIIIKK